MLYFECAGAIASDFKCAAGFLPALESQFGRFRKARQFLADDLFPMAQKIGFGKAFAIERFFGQSRNLRAQTPGFPLAFFRDGSGGRRFISCFCHLFFFFRFSNRIVLWCVLMTRASRSSLPEKTSRSRIRRRAVKDHTPFSAEAGRRLSRLLLRWYDRQGRDLPWRQKGTAIAADPYAVWLSEIMLQQTTVATVKERFRRFLSRWPRLSDLAAAPLEEVLAEWAGLGYYARARNLHACAKIVVAEYGGRFPSEETALRALPGIGDYTAAAIASIAFGERAIVVDGNVERVLARLVALPLPLPQARSAIYAIADSLTPEKRAGDYAQALMDLGATICSPRSPQCSLCPWQKDCRARQRQEATLFPRKMPKIARPERYGIAFLLRDRQGRIALRRRPMRGLLGGMMEVPGTPWRDSPWQPEEALAFSLVANNQKKKKLDQWRWLEGNVRHVFTHFALELQVAVAQQPLTLNEKPEGIDWFFPKDLDILGLPTLMRKVVEKAMGE